MENTSNKPTKFNELSEIEKLELFKVEELEGRLETAWNDSCSTTNDGCQNTGCDNTTNNGCSSGGGGGGTAPPTTT